MKPVTIDSRGYKSYESIDDLSAAIREAISNRRDSDEICYTTLVFNMFCHVFGGIPNLISEFGKTDNSFLHPENFEYEKEKDRKKKEALKNAIYGDKDTFDIDINKTVLNLMELYKGRCFLYRSDEYPILVTNDFITCIRYNSFRLLTKDIKLSDEIMNAIVRVPKSDAHQYMYVVKTMQGFDTNCMEVKHRDADLDLIYNDDLPHDEIMEFIDCDDSGLMIFHGEPGTGKSSYIRYLIEQFPNNKFMVLDQSVFNYITDASFIQLLMYNANCVVILEDCENMVTERNGKNSAIAPLLNLTDGIIGDSFSLKFICTFNTEINNIDKALLRKGRLKMKYEFKKLGKDKVAKIAENKGIELDKVEDMTLADIMNYEAFNGHVNKKNNIGFGK